MLVRVWCRGHETNVALLSDLDFCVSRDTNAAFCRVQSLGFGVVVTAIPKCCLGFSARRVERHEHSIAEVFRVRSQGEGW